MARIWPVALLVLAECGSSPGTGLPDDAAPTDSGGAIDLAIADLAMPDLATPDLAMPDLAMPDLAMPDLATPDLATPDLATPDLATPDLAMPDLAMPDLAMPDLAMPDLVAGSDGSPADLATATSNIKHVIIIVQENHTFDSYFGGWCTATAGTNPTCTAGPSCCEAAPAKDPSGTSPVTLDDSENSSYDPTHSQSCELSEIHAGAMDRFVTGASCSNAKNFAVASKTVLKPYHDWATQYALADRYFQPVAGASSSNDLYFAVAKFVFLDNTYQPNTAGNICEVPPTPTIEYTGQTTIADLLIAAGHSFAFYAEGYAAMRAAAICPAAPADCPAHVPTPPCVYSGSDVPFQYYQQFADNLTYMKDYGDLANDIAASKLPEVSFVKHVQYKNEHPGYGTTISAGITAVQSTVALIQSSPYASDTLILLTWDEGGGFFDHVTPPATSTVDNQPYGTRVPLLAIGPFARVGTVSHTAMEHSSILRFLELNFLGAVGQLGARDATVANLGSLLDPSKTGLVIP